MDTRDIVPTLQLLMREASFQNALLYIDNLDAWKDRERVILYQSLLEAIAQHTGMTILAGVEPWMPSVTNLTGIVKVEREGKPPLITYFGGVCLRWNKWVNTDDTLDSKIWNGRSEVVERLLAQKCEICGATDNIEVHHIHKLADIKQKGNSKRPEWMKKMSARQRKTLVVCRQCHEKIQYGRYDGKTLKRKDYRKAT